MSSEPSGGGRAERDPAVLRLAALGDVELREHLEARRDAVGEPLRDSLHLLEHAVDPEADEEAVVLRLDVDVAGPLLGRLEDDRVDEPHERRVRDAVVDLEVVLLVFLDELELGDVGVSARAERLVRAREALDLGEHVIARRDGELDRVLGREPELVDRRDVGWIGDCHLEDSRGSR